MKKLIKWALALIGIIVGMYALLFTFGIWLAYEVGKHLDYGYRPSTSTRLIRFEVGDKVFVIPQNHIWDREDWKGGKTLGVSMHALLPDFEPYTEANRHEFDKPGWDREVHISLSAHNLPEVPGASASMTRQEIYERLTHEFGKSAIVSKSRGPYGLTKVQLDPSLTPYPKYLELYTGRKKNGDFYWVTCKFDGQVPYPSCETNIEYSKHVTIRYAFAKKYLSDWQVIEDGVLKLIQQFENNASGGRS